MIGKDGVLMPGLWFGDLMAALMTDQGMSQADLARKTGLSPAAISNLVNGVTSPQQQSVDKLVEALFPPRKRNSAMAALLRQAAVWRAPNPRLPYQGWDY